MTGCGPILAAYRRHRARSRRAWAIALIGPPEAVAATVAELEPDPARVHWVRDGASGRLASADRDRLLERQALIVFAASDVGAWSRLRATAPDLTTSLDGVFEVEAPAPPPPPWPVVREGLTASVSERTRTLDLAGLFDGDPVADTPPDVSLQDTFVGLVLPPPHGARRMVLLADAGQGKTTYLRWLAQTRPADVVGDSVPVWLSLAEYGRDAERALRPVAAFLAQALEHGASLADHAGEIVVLADGLDEIASPAARRAVVQDLASGPWGAVVLTGRRFVADDLGPGWVALVRRPFDRVRRAAVVRKLAAARGQRPAEADRVVARIEADPAVDRAVCTPLLAVFAAVLDGELPTRRVELYERVSTLLVDRWAQARGRTGGARAQTLRVLGPLGWRLATSPGSALGEAALRSVLSDIERGIDPAGVERRVDGLLATLQVPWRLPHASIAQYFAALEAIRTPEAWKRLLAHPFEPNLAEVTGFAAAVLDVIRADDVRRDELVRAVLRLAKRPGRYGAVHPSVLGRLIVDTEHVGASLYGELVRRWCDLVFKAAYGAEANRVVEEEAREVLEAMRHHPRAVLFGEVVAARRGAVDWQRRTRDGLEPALTGW